MDMPSGAVPMKLPDPHPGSSTRAWLTPNPVTAPHIASTIAGDV
ncbi:hypothetical protein SB749_12565 [Brevibacterium sp. SIMBA_078]